MISRELERRRQSKNYYRDNLRRMASVLFITLVVIVFFILFTLYRFFTLPEPYYYATATNGALTQLIDVPKGTGLIERNQT